MAVTAKILAGLSILAAIAGFSAIDALGDMALIIGGAGWIGTFVFADLAERHMRKTAS